MSASIDNPNQFGDAEVPIYVESESEAELDPEVELGQLNSKIEKLRQELHILVVAMNPQAHLNDVTKAIAYLKPNLRRRLLTWFQKRKSISREPTELEQELALRQAQLAVIKAKVEPKDLSDTEKKQIADLFPQLRYQLILLLLERYELKIKLNDNQRTAQKNYDRLEWEQAKENKDKFFLEKETRAALIAEKEKLDSLLRGSYKDISEDEITAETKERERIARLKQISGERKEAGIDQTTKETLAMVEAKYGKGWKLDSIDPRSAELNEIDFSKVTFDSIRKSGEAVVKSEEAIKRQWSDTTHIPLSFSVLWANRDKIPDEYKDGRWIFADAEVLESPRRRRFTLSLYWDGGEWVWDYHWVESDRGSGCVSARLPVSSPNP